MKKIELKPWMVKKQTNYGEVEQRYGHDCVYVNGQLAGYVPVEGEPAAGVFHPLSGFPQEWCKDVCDQLKLDSSLPAPVPHEEPEMVDDE